ncbi:MAG: enoyl-CoA hydratase [Proteobacteria bacterium]|nr:enoyl-CoA hydratase [Pseudomonadota bacterium]
MSLNIETRNGVARLQIARPEKKNAITVAMYDEMATFIASVSADAASRVLLIHGLEDVFTAGNDLEDFARRPPTGEDAPVLRFIHALDRCEVPVVAAVNGVAVGIGATMLMHCDLAYCATDSVLSMPFVTLGLCPEFAASALLPLLAGSKAASEKLLLGDPISAAEAVEMRLVNRALPPDEVLAHAERQAERFVSLPPVAVRESKRLMRKALNGLVAPAIAAEAEVFMRLLRGPEAREAFTAFFERRRPDFTRSAP